LEDFDGICISKKSDLLTTFIEQLFWVKENCPQNKHLHVLGMSGIRFMLSIFYILKDRPDLTITFDSTSWLIEGKNKMYRNPLMANQKFDLTAQKYESFDYSICSCGACKKITEQQSRGISLNEERCYFLFSLHNLSVMLNIVKQANVLFNFNEEVFKEFCLPLMHSKILPVKILLELINTANQKGFGYAKEKYAYLFTEHLKSIKTKQKNIFSC
jgi:queuine/archaeosine tRNA-ribosyltransferase